MGSFDQAAYWRDADDAHFRWQTGRSYFAECERALVAMAGIAADTPRLLEVGCGEGANLVHLSTQRGARPSSGWIGVDFAAAKVAHAAHVLPGCAFARADATRLPFADGAFDAVLVRDVLHHVDARAALVVEAARVLRPGGRLAVIEPNRASPLIVAQALLVRAERAVLRSTAARLRRELTDAGLRDVGVERAHPFPLARVLANPRLPLAAPDALLRAADRVAAAVVPRAAWMYLVATGQRPPTR
jgi:ubiquinone/menaquinone biosynthesis C-methylase UbiE